MSSRSRGKICVFWFRRDLRLRDNRGLNEALASGVPVLPLFVFDTDILSELKDRDDKRVQFIHDSVVALDEELRALGSALVVRSGKPLDVLKSLAKEFTVEGIYFNHDYEPAGISRDEAVRKAFGGKVTSSKDHVIFEKDEVVKDDGSPYTMFTPYFRKWLAAYAEHPPLISRRTPPNFYKQKPGVVPTLASLGFERTDFAAPEAKVPSRLISSYASTRDTPAAPGTSRLGVHLRFGTISIRELAKKARAAASDDVFLKELAWREFFTQILWHFPHVVRGPFRPEYAKVKFRHDEKEFELWAAGKTGYPLVDAGMRELNATGFMHNRVRMIAASFLVKHLAIDYKWGEGYFARKLLDYELASNNGNWQWVAGTGCDAAPYFRVFNPETQRKKFDRGGEYVRRWVPEWETSKYPEPIVDHVEARTRIMRLYSSGLGRKVPAPSR